MKNILRTIARISFALMTVYALVGTVILAVMTLKMRNAPGLFEKLAVFGNHDINNCMEFAFSVLVFDVSMILLVVFLYVRNAVMVELFGAFIKKS
jgi:hypothetical protein